MANWMRTLWNALLFRDQGFSDFRRGGGLFLQGLALIALVALLTGLPALAIDAIGGLRHTAAEADLSQARAGFEEFLRRAEPFLQNLPDEARRQFLEQMRLGFQMSMEITAEVVGLPTALPGPLVVLLEAAGDWLSRPFGGGFPLAAAALGTWLGYGIWVMLFAKLLGGKGGLADFFGTTALYATPHLLAVFDRVPYLGSLLGVVAYFWGAALYVKAVKISHDLTYERAFLAAILPLLIAVGLLVLLAMALAGLIAIAIASAG
jgi:hypothetical protein